MTVARDQLKSFVERAENLDREIKELNSDKSDLFKEAKAAGFDPIALKAVIRHRRAPAEAEELSQIVETYLAALGSGTPVALARARARDEAA